MLDSVYKLVAIRHTTNPPRMLRENTQVMDVRVSVERMVAGNAETFVEGLRKARRVK